MYKVFFNEREISFVPFGNITLIKPSFIFNSNCTKTEIQSWFQQFLKSDEKKVTIAHPDPEKLVELFESLFIPVPAAGGVVRNKNKILFIYRNNTWDLPKGKIDKGESVEKAALREVEEECGITGHKIIKTLPSTFHIYQSPYKKTFGKWILKKTFWYEMEYSGNNKGRPQKEEGITKVEWLTKNELNEITKNTYENLKQIIQLYLD